MKKLHEIVEAVKEYPVKTIAVAAAADPSVLAACMDASSEGVGKPIFVGDGEKLMELASQAGYKLDPNSIVDEPDNLKAAAQATKLVSSGEADILMKGYIHTDDFLRAMLNKEWGLRASVVMSHVFVVEIPGYDRLIMITDGAMNIQPSLERKAEIILNADHLANILGIEQPRVAALAAIELLNPSMQATIDATCLHKMSERGQFVPHCIVDGPFALDNAISEIAAKHKGIEGPVAGNADILLVPDIEAGNMLAKSTVYFAGAKIAGVIVGAKAPVVLTSRADCAYSKFVSIALAVYMSNVKRSLKLKIGKVHY